MASPKEKPDIPADMWLHVATDALARYVAGGGVVSIVADDGPGLCLRLPAVAALNDPRLAPSFLALLAQNAPAPEEPAP